MDKALDEMLEKVRTWPEERQRDVLDTLRRMEEEGTAPYQLSDAERVLVQEALEEADRGEFATRDEVKAFFQRNKKR